MVTALAVLAALLALLLVLLALPLELGFDLAGRPAPAGRVSFGWPGVRVSLPLRGGGAAAAQARRREGRVAGKRPPLRALWRRKAFRRRALRFARDLLGALRVRQLRLRLRFGLDDPADTGRLWALAGPLLLLVPRRGADVQVQPDFDGAVLDWQAQGRLRLVPLRVVALTLGFVLSPVSLRTWRALRAGHG